MDDWWNDEKEKMSEWMNVLYLERVRNRSTRGEQTDDSDKVCKQTLQCEFNRSLTEWQKASKELFHIVRFIHCSYFCHFVPSIVRQFIFFSRKITMAHHIVKFNSKHSSDEMILQQLQQWHRTIASKELHEDHNNW